MIASCSLGHCQSVCIGRRNEETGVYVRCINLLRARTTFEYRFHLTCCSLVPRPFDLRGGEMLGRFVEGANIWYQWRIHLLWTEKR